MPDITYGAIEHLKEQLIRHYEVLDITIILPNGNLHEDPYGTTGVISVVTEHGSTFAKYDSSSLDAKWQSFFITSIRNLINSIEVPGTEEPLFTL